MRLGMFLRNKNSDEKEKFYHYA